MKNKPKKNKKIEINVSIKIYGHKVLDGKEIRKMNEIFDKVDEEVKKIHELFKLK